MSQTLPGILEMRDIIKESRASERSTA